MAKAKYTPEELKARRSAQAKAQWAARGAGGLREANIKANTKEPPHDVLEIVEKACANGCTVEQIAGALGVNRKLFGEWRERYPEIEAAMTAGRAVEHDALVGALFKAATREKGPNLVAAIFLLKARHAYREGEAPVNNTVSINFMLPKSLTPEQYAAKVANETRLLPPGEATRLARLPEVKRELAKDLTRRGEVTE